MKEIELLNNPEEGSIYDTEMGDYRVVKSGLDDIIIVKNYRYKKIKKLDIVSLNTNEEQYKIETVENCEKYIVKPMDTLMSISKKVGESVDNLKQKNNLTTDKLFIGQILKI